jgi:hypothetical protein
MANETQLTTMANQLLTCFCEQLATYPSPPADCCLRTGDLTIHDFNAENGLDKTCCPGLAYVRIGSMFPSSNFPAPDTEPGKGTGCFPVSWAVELTLGTVRCVPGMGATAGPDCVDWTAAAQTDANDMEAMRKALCCWAPLLPRGRLWLAGTSTVNLAGDCIERILPVLVGLPKCC